MNKGQQSALSKQPKTWRGQAGRFAATAAGCVFLPLFAAALPALAQTTSGPGGATTTTGSSAGSAQQSTARPQPEASAAGNASSVAAGQGNLYNATGTNGASPTQNSFQGSLIAGRNTGTNLDLTLDDAMQRGLRQNLGAILEGSAAQAANGQRLELLQQLLPTVTAGSSISVEQINLAAEGFKFKGIKPIIGPFQVVDFRAYLTQNVVNISALQSYIASKHNFAAAQLTAADAHDLVVLTVGNAYLVCVADAARIAAVDAELKTSKVTLDQANDAHNAGVSPRLDVLRAQVDFQNEQQRLISTNNDLAKDKIALARAIGLPLDQQFTLVDSAPYKALDDLNADTAFEQAVKTRKDLAAAGEQVKAAEAQRRAALADRYPVASISGDYGDIGTTPAHSHGTFTATGQVTVPVLQIVRDRGERQVADATLVQSKARLSDQVQQVNADVRTSILDIQSAAKLVQATKSNVDLAAEELSEAQQRFHAGVSDNLPVSQAQSELEQANDQYISALYQHNVAKLSLARSLGVAASNYKDYLGGK